MPVKLHCLLDPSPNYSNFVKNGRLVPVDNKGIANCRGDAWFDGFMSPHPNNNLIVMLITVYEVNKRLRVSYFFVNLSL